MTGDLYILSWVKVDAGTHHVASSGNPGFQRALGFTDAGNKITGPAEYRPATRDSVAKYLARSGPSTGQTFPRALAQSVRSGATQGFVAVAAVAIAPVAVKLGQDGWNKAREFVRSMRNKPTPEHGSGESRAPEPAPEPESADAPVSMSAEEYRHRLLRVLLVEQDAEQEKAILARVPVDDGALPVEVRTVLRAVLGGPVSAVDPADVEVLVAFLVSASVEGESFDLVQGDVTG